MVENNFCTNSNQVNLNDLNEVLYKAFRKKELDKKVDFDKLSKYKFARFSPEFKEVFKHLFQENKSAQLSEFIAINHNLPLSQTQCFEIVEIVFEKLFASRKKILNKKHNLQPSSKVKERSLFLELSLEHLLSNNKSSKSVLIDSIKQNNSLSLKIKTYDFSQNKESVDDFFYRKNLKLHLSVRKSLLEFIKEGKGLLSPLVIA